MPTPIFICGAECGIAVVGTASAGTEHWSTVSGAVSLVTSGPSPMRSTRCFRLNPAAGFAALQHTLATAIASPATMVARFYVYFASLPTTDVDLGGTSNYGCWFKNSDSTLRAGVSTSNMGASGVTVTTGVWYRIDLKIVLNTTRTVDMRVDGVAVAQYSEAGAAGTITTPRLGNGGSTSPTMDVYMDDLAVSGTAADYPIGAGTVAGLYPNGDSTNSAANATDGNGGHFFSAGTDFGKGAGGATVTGTQNVESTSWQSLQNPLSTTIPTNFIADISGGTAEYLVWTLDDLPGTAATVNGVMQVATTHSASATTNNFQTGLASAAPTTGSRINAISADLSEITITVPVFTWGGSNPNPPGGGTITVSAVNGWRVWFASNDVTPDVYLDGVCLEVDYVPTSGVARTFTGKAATSSSAKASLRVSPTHFAAKAASSTSAKALRINRTQRLVAKAGAASNAKALILLRAKSIVAKAGTASSAKATLSRIKLLVAKSGTASNAKATKLNQTKRLLAKAPTATSAKASARTARPIAAKAPTATSAKALILKRSKNITAKAATATSAKALILRRSKNIVAKSGTATSAKADLTRTLGGATRTFSAKVPISTSAKATRVTRAARLVAKAPTTSNAKASKLTQAKRLLAKVGTASSAKAITIDKVGQKAFVAKSSTAASAKATRVVRAARLLAKAGTATSAKASARAARKILAKSGTSTSAKASLGRSRPVAAKAPTATSAKASLGKSKLLTAKASTASSAKATRVIRAARLIAKAPTASNAKASIRINHRLIAKAGTASGVRATMVVGRQKPMAAKAATATKAKASLTVVSLALLPADVTLSLERPFLVDLGIDTSVYTCTLAAQHLFLVDLEVQSAYGCTLTVAPTGTVTLTVEREDLMAADQPLFVGQRVRVHAAWTAVNVPTDPTSIVARVLHPSGTVTTATVVHEGTGLDHVDVDLDEDGVWWVRFEGEPPVAAANEIVLVVEKSKFPATV